MASVRDHKRVYLSIAMVSLVVQLLFVLGAAMTPKTSETTKSKLADITKQSNANTANIEGLQKSIDALTVTVENAIKNGNGQREKMLSNQDEMIEHMQKIDKELEERDP